MDQKQEQVVIEIGKRILEIRKALEIKQADFAAALEISAGYMSELEKGKRRPTALILPRLLSLYNVNLNYIFSGEGKLFNEPKDGGENREMVENLVTEEDFYWFMKRSNMFSQHIMSTAINYYIENQKTIYKNIKAFLKS